MRFNSRPQFPPTPTSHQTDYREVYRIAPHPSSSAHDQPVKAHFSSVPQRTYDSFPCREFDERERGGTNIDARNYTIAGDSPLVPSSAHHHWAEQYQYKTPHWEGGAQPHPASSWPPYHSGPSQSYPTPPDTEDRYAGFPRDNGAHANPAESGTESDRGIQPPSRWSQQREQKPSLSGMTSSTQGREVVTNRTTDEELTKVSKCLSLLAEGYKKSLEAKSTDSTNLDNHQSTWGELGSQIDDISTRISALEGVLDGVE
ncbi:hypothetical protein HK102_013987, partial [Quaeritorhiza haematococci]